MGLKGTSIKNNDSETLRTVRDAAMIMCKEVQPVIEHSRQAINKFVGETDLAQFSGAGASDIVNNFKTASQCVNEIQTTMEVIQKELNAKVQLAEEMEAQAKSGAAAAADRSAGHTSGKLRARK